MRTVLLVGVGIVIGYYGVKWIKKLNEKTINISVTDTNA